MWDAVVFVLLAWVLPVVINKTTESGHFQWVRPHLRLIWTVIFAVFTLYFLQKPAAQEVAVTLHAKWRGGLGYAIAAVSGAILLSGYWWMTGKMLPTVEAAKVNKAEVMSHARWAVSQLRDFQRDIEQEDRHLSDAYMAEVHKILLMKPEDRQPANDVLFNRNVQEHLDLSRRRKDKFAILRIRVLSARNELLGALPPQPKPSLLIKTTIEEGFRVDDYSLNAVADYLDLLVLELERQ